MALRKSTNLLPSIFQTKANEKYLNATLDQLISEPNNTQLNQFIGRKTGGSFQKNDSYVQKALRRDKIINLSLVWYTKTVVVM